MKSVVAVAALAAMAALPSPARADEGTALVGDLRGVFGKHPHARAVHAKGVVLEGSFSPTAAAKDLSTAAVFAGDAIPVTIRFSTFPGAPDVPDNLHEAGPRGLAIKFRTPAARALDVVSHAFNGFPVATAHEFGMFLRAIAASGPHAEKPTALDKFVAGHPTAATFLVSQKPPPVGYATDSYFGVNAFAFIDGAGRRTLVRYRFVPEAGEHYVDEGTREALGPNYLREEMEKRLAKGHAAFDWMAQIAEPGDKPDDPSVAWPETRRLVKLGTLRIDRVISDEAKADKKLVFMPGNPPLGIEAADPMLAVRNQAYSVSFDERQ